MIPSSMRIFVATEPADMRCQIDGLAKAVRERFGEDPLVENSLWVFTNRGKDRLKILWRDKTGWCLLYKRLDVRKVLIPVGDGPRIDIDMRKLGILLDGADIATRKPTAREIARRARNSLEIHEQLRAKAR